MGSSRSGTKRLARGVNPRKFTTREKIWINILQKFQNTPCRVSLVIYWSVGSIKCASEPPTTDAVEQSVKPPTAVARNNGFKPASINTNMAWWYRRKCMYVCMYVHRVYKYLVLRVCIQKCELASWPTLITR